MRLETLQLLVGRLVLENLQLQEDIQMLRRSLESPGEVEKEVPVKSSPSGDEVLGATVSGTPGFQSSV